MTNNSYDVVFEGTVIEGFDSDLVKEKFGTTFNKGPDVVEKLFSGGRLVIKKGVNKETAAKYAEKLQEIGVKYSIVPALEESKPPTPSDSKPTDQKNEPKKESPATITKSTLPPTQNFKPFIPSSPNLSDPKPNSKTVTGQIKKPAQTYPENNFYRNKDTKISHNPKTEDKKEDFHDFLLGLIVLAVLLVVFAFGAIGVYRWLFKSDSSPEVERYLSEVDNDFENSTSHSIYVAIRELLTADREVQFNMSVKKSPWEFVRVIEKPGDSPLSNSVDTEITFKNGNYTAEVIFLLAPDTTKRMLIAKQSLTPDRKTPEANSYEILFYFNQESGKAQIEKIQVKLVSEIPDRYDPFLGHIYEFSTEKYRFEKQDDYSPGKCLLILAEGEFSSGGSIYERITKLLPDDMIATNLDNLSTIFRVKERNLVRQKYSDGSPASESLIDIEVIDTRTIPFKIVKEETFSGGYKPPQKKYRRGGYASPLPVEAAKEYIINLYK